MDASVRGKLRHHICVDNSDLSWQCHNQINYVNSCIESAKIHHPSNNCQNDDVWSLSGTIFSHSPTNTQINAMDQNKNSQTTKSLFWDQQDWVWYMKRRLIPLWGINKADRTWERRIYSSSPRSIVFLRKQRHAESGASEFNVYFTLVLVLDCCLYKQTCIYFLNVLDKSRCVGSYLLPTLLLCRYVEDVTSITASVRVSDSSVCSGNTG